MPELPEGHTALQCVADWLHDDNHGFKIPDTEWGRCLYSALGEVVAAATPRVVSTVAELDALPAGTIFRVKNGTPWEVMDNSDDEYDYRFESVHMKGRYQAKTFADELPATVLWVGGTE